MLTTFRDVVEDATREYQDAGPVDKVGLGLWLLGPFMLFWERTPADVWLSLLVLLFLIFKLKHNLSLICRSRWLVLPLLFWIACLFSGLVSAMPAYSVTEALIWVRFPLLVVCVAFWISQFTRFFLMSIYLWAILAVSISCGLFVEFWSLFVINELGDGRLTWPYGDPVPGAAIAKACLPSLLFLVFFTDVKDATQRYFGQICFFVALVGIVMSGERIHALIFICSFLLCLLLMHQEFKKYWKSLLIVATLLSLMFIFHPRTHTKVKTFLANIMDFDGNYFLTIMGGIEAFKSAPVFGIGPANYRYLCFDVVPRDFVVVCNNHPHNYYAQILGEVGFVGFLLASLFYISLLAHVFRGWKNKHYSLNWVVGFVVPIAFFFPLQSTGDFFGQWFNIFTWTGLATAVGIATLSNKTH